GRRRRPPARKPGTRRSIRRPAAGAKRSVPSLPPLGAAVRAASLQTEEDPTLLLDRLREQAVQRGHLAKRGLHDVHGLQTVVQPIVLGIDVPDSTLDRCHVGENQTRGHSRYLLRPELPARPCYPEFVGYD